MADSNNTQPPPGPSDPAPVAAYKADELKGIEIALAKLADEYKKAAEWHLVRAAVGLVIGFFTALLLPVAFTLIDAYVERKLADWRSQGAADQSQVDGGVAKEIAQVRQQRIKYQQDTKSLLRNAYDSHFGTVVFGERSYIQDSGPIRLDYRNRQTLACKGIARDVISMN